MNARRHVLRHTAGLLSLLAAAPAFGQTWDGSGFAGGAVTWTTATNWDPDGVPANTGAANIVMAGVIDLTPDMDAAWNINSLTFNNTAGAFNMVSSGGFALTVGNITNSDIQIQTITHALAPKAGAVWSATSGGLTFVGVVGGSNGFTKQGSAALTLSGAAANTCIGPITVGNGPLILQKTSGLAAIAGPLIIGDGSGTDTVSYGSGSSNQIADASAVTLDAGAQFLLANESEIIGALTIGSGALVNTGASAGALTASSLAINGGSLAGAGTGSFRLNGNLTSDTTGASAINMPSFHLGSSVRTFTVAQSPAAVDVEVTGNVNNGGIIKEGAGTLRLASPNSFASGVVLNAGTVVVSTNTSLGTGLLGLGSGTIAADVPGLTLNNAIQTGAVAVQFGGSEAFTLAGNVTLTGDPVFNVNGPSGVSLNGVLGPAAARAFTKTGPGMLTLGGIGSNTIFGVSVINEGTVTLAKTGGATAVTSSITVGDGTGADVLSVPSPNNQLADTAQVTINPSGTLQVGPGTETMGRLNVTGGAVELNVSGTLNVTGGLAMVAGSIEDGTLGLSSNLSVVANPVSAVIDSDVDLNGATRTVQVADDVTNPFDLVINGEISDGNVIKSGAGTLRLTAANTFADGFTIAAGEVVLDLDTSPGTGPLLISNGAIRSGGGLRNLSNPVTLTGNPTFGGADTLVFSGPVTLSGAGPLSFTNSAVTQFTAPISESSPGSGFIRGTATGGAVLFTISAPNSYTGPTEVRNGALVLASASGITGIPGDLLIGDGVGAANSDVVQLLGHEQIANTSAVTVNGGAPGSALFDLNGRNETIGSLALTGGKVSTGTATLTVAGGVTTFPSAGISSIAGRMNLNGVRPFAVENGAADPDLSVTALLVDGTLEKNGAGKLALPAAVSSISVVLNAGQLDGNFLVQNGRTFTQNGGTYDDILTNQGTFIFNGGVCFATLNNTGQCIVNGGLAMNAVTNSGSITINAPGTFSTPSNVFNNGTINLAGGSFTVNDSLVPSTLINNSLITGHGTIAGTAAFINNATITQSGGNLTLNSASSTNGGSITLEAGRQLTLGTPLLNNGSLDLNNGFVQGAGTLTNAAGGSITGRGAISAPLSNTGGFLANDAGTLNIFSPHTNAGTIALDGLTAALNGGTITNNGTIHGRGNIGNNINNSQTIEASAGTLTLAGAITNTGLLAAGAGAKLLISGTFATNAGTVSLTGGTFDTAGDALDSTGQITGYGIVRTGGLTNNGGMTLTGGLSTVNGSVTNAAGRTIHVAHNPAIFTGNVTNNGIFKNTETTVTFTGLYTENGTFVSDPADNYFNDLTIGTNGKLTGGIGDRFFVLGDFTNGSTQSAAWTTHDSDLIFEGGPVHTFALAGTDAGPDAAGYSANFAWKSIRLTAGQSLILTDGNAVPGAALYTRAFILDGGLAQISSITGNGFTIYYDPADAANAPLNGQTYPLTGGGFLRPIGVTLAITGSGFLPDGTLQIDVLGVPHALHHIEASTDLVTFTLIGTATPGVSGIFSHLDPDAAILRRRCYRIVKP